MSSTTLPNDFSPSREEAATTENDILNGVVKVMEVVGSLKLTCVLFVLAMIVVFVGSLAQSRRDVWPVMAQYFRVWQADIDVQDLFPPSMFGSVAEYYGVDDFGALVAEKIGPFRKIPFPGGWTIGVLMLINLTAAHALKFRVRARGLKLAAGIGLTVLGLLLTLAVVVTGNMQTGVDFGNTMLSADAIWYLMLSGLALAGSAAVASACFAPLVTTTIKTSMGPFFRWFLFAVGVLFLGVAIAFLIGGKEAQFNLSNMRILWQLLKGGACALILLMGANLLFDKRGGIAVLHFGVAMLMISELQVGLQAKENMLSLIEGESSNMIRDIRIRELAIVRHKDEKKDTVVRVLQHRLESAAKNAAQTKEEDKSGADFGGPISPSQTIQFDEEYNVPFDIAVRRFYLNSALRSALPDDTLKTSAGLGKFAVAKDLPPVTGMESSSDTSTVYVDLLEKGTQKVIQSLMVSQNASEGRGVPLAEKVTIGDTDYFFFLQFERSFLPHQVKLMKTSRKDYIGTSTPRDYRSVIEISGAEGEEPEEFTVWMNNPLRFNGETYYQTGHQPLGDGRAMSTLSVVNNQGWMLPYIACMIVMFGMFAQFGQTLFKFLDRAVLGPQLATAASPPRTDIRPGFGPARFEVDPNAVAASPLKDAPLPWVLKFGIPLLVILVTMAYVGRKAILPKTDPKTMNIYEFGQLPVAWSGRPQPIDSMARVQLMAASTGSTFSGELDAAELSAAEHREEILKAIAAGWPSVDLGKFKDFNGSYSEWIEKIADLTASGEEAIEERMRPVMVSKMPAIRWLLDVMTRPEVAARHRIYKIEDDTLLSMLDLEKRPGLMYSLVEIQKNFKAMEPALQSGRKKQANNASGKLTDIERRVGALFETMSRVDQLSQVFILRDSDGLLGAYVDSWRVLRLLGATAPVSAIPTGSAEDKRTGSTEETRTWETMIAANSVRQLNDRMTESGIVTLGDFKKYVKETLPKELVDRSIIGSYQILRDGAAQSSDAASDGTVDVQLQAKIAAARVQDEFLHEILAIIAEADPKLTPQEIAATVPAEKIAEIGATRVSAEMFDVFSTISERDPKDKRLEAIRTRLQKLAIEDSKAVSSAMNDELIELVWNDLHERVGHVMPGGENSKTFNTNALAMKNVLVAWQEGDLEAFNNGIKEYREKLTSENLPYMSMGAVKLESWFNFIEPFYLTGLIYVPVMILSFIGWLCFGKVLRNTSIALMLLGFTLHTVALILRMWISGRPPVTNLYSSAIFIGWGVVLGSFAIEFLVKHGIGNLIGSSVGSATLLIAHYLAQDEGDTLGVMQAVLDTKFWLATHVVCISLGYTATFVAGFLGIAYCMRAMIDRHAAGMGDGARVTEEFKVFGKMVYGVVCFAIFFSLVGTVLGGLWADDSWGRFWGWDPKENGAMMIVLWNAIVLHARWGRLVGDFGTSVLAIIGNVITTWSWFGVNQLQAGLHSYGFTEGRLLAMLAFMASQMTLVLVFAAFAWAMKRSSTHSSPLTNA